VCNSIFFFVSSSLREHYNNNIIYLQNITLCALHQLYGLQCIFILYSFTESPVYIIHISPTVVHRSCACVCVYVCVCESAAYTCCCWKKNENNNNNDYDNNKEQKTHVSLDSRRTHSYVLAYRLRTIKKKPIYILYYACVCVCVYKTPLLRTAATHYEAIGRVHTKLYNIIIMTMITPKYTV